MDDMGRLMIEHDCGRLIVAYSHMIDFGDAGSIADLFTEDGVWESTERRLGNRAEIAESFAQRQANTGRRSRHVCTNVAIDVVSPDEATGVSYYTLYREDDVESETAELDGPAMVGDYRDRFVRTPDGWRIAHRQATAAFVRVRG
jgi:hypothetical protein